MRTVNSPDDRLIGSVLAPDLHVMSFNIRRRMPPPNWRARDRWERRAPSVAALLRTEAPTVLGVQEALPDQAAFVRAALGARYRFVGRGHGAEGRGEGNPLFYDNERLELLGWEQSALSDKPDTTGSRSWGNLIPRIAVSARLRDRETLTQFFAVNTHFDHLSRRSRVRSAEAIRRLTTEQQMPAIVTGDLNAGERSAALRELLSGGLLRDSWRAAEERVTLPWGTFPHYREPHRDGRRIDWIVVSPGVRVKRAAINPSRYARGWASDHLPVQAVVELTRRDTIS